MSTKGKVKTKLGLKLPTDPRWANLAEMKLEDILTDHAYCEQKAATACISLIQLCPDKEFLVDELSPIVTEEWGHFRLVIAELKKRGLKLGFQRKDVYVQELMKFQRKGGSKNDRLLDRLITCAMIEARSCERFRILSLNLDEQYLRDFYHHFMISEAGHYKTFLNLAKHYTSNIVAMERWQECLTYEAAILKNLTPSGDRIH